MATVTSLHGRRLGIEVGTDDLVLQGGVKKADGSPVSTFPKVPSYTVANAPSAATAGAGALIYASNGAAGAGILAYSDGTNWKRVDTAATISAI